MSDIDPIPAEDELRRVPDGGILWTTPSGLLMISSRCVHAYPVME